MRTTVTIDADVEELLRESMQRGRKSFKQALNEALRRGLRSGKKNDEPPFRVEARPLGLREGIDPTQLHDLDAELEVDEFLRKIRDLEKNSS